MQPICFIHASDLHLDRPPRGLAELPDTLRGVLIEAPHRAALRIFDAALKENVDFIVLSGDIVNPRLGGPRSLVFLEEQFSRLAQRGIQVYWSGGRDDGFKRWAEAWPLPQNVLRFPHHRVERFVHRRGGEPIAQILGASVSRRRRIPASDFRPEDKHLFSIAAFYGLGDANTLSGHDVNYWALGGRHQRRTMLTGLSTANYPGTPQGRHPRESAPCGCTLVHVDHDRRTRTTFVPTDAVRFHDELLRIPSPITDEQLYELLNERIAELAGDPFGPDWLIDWTLVGNDAIERRLRRGTLAGEMTARLRGEHAAKRPAVWTVSIRAATSNPVDRLFDEQTVLGEMLRNVRHFAEHIEEPLGLETHMAGPLAAGIRWRAALDQPGVRQRVLAEVAKLGVELLSPEEVGP